MATIYILPLTVVRRGRVRRVAEQTVGVASLPPPTVRMSPQSPRGAAAYPYQLIAALPGTHMQEAHRPSMASHPRVMEVVSWQLLAIAAPMFQRAAA